MGLTFGSAPLVAYEAQCCPYRHMYTPTQPIDIPKLRGTTVLDWQVGENMPMGFKMACLTGQGKLAVTWWYKTTNANDECRVYVPGASPKKTQAAKVQARGSPFGTKPKKSPHKAVKKDKAKKAEKAKKGETEKSKQPAKAAATESTAHKRGEAAKPQTKSAASSSQLAAKDAVIKRLRAKLAKVKQVIDTPTK